MYDVCIWQMEISKTIDAFGSVRHLRKSANLKKSDSMNSGLEPIEANISELRSKMKNVTVAFKVIGKGEVREVSSRRDNEAHKVQDAIVGDTSAIVTVPLWDDIIEKVEVGESYKLENGHTGLFRSNLRLKIGRYGEISEAKTEVEKVNEEIDMSAENHKTNRRRHYGGYGYRDSRRAGYGGYGNRSDRSSYRSRSSAYRRRRR